MFCGILNQTHVANSHSAFGQFVWFSGKCVSEEKMRFATCKRPLGRVLCGGLLWWIVLVDAQSNGMQ